MKFKINLVLICWCFWGYSQQPDSTQTPSFLRGQITLTNNGISLIPSFSLGKPAILFDMSMGKGRLSFDPMIRFGANAKPWAFVFWWRYKMIQQKKFNFGIGAHPSFVFREITVNDKGVNKQLLSTQRYFAWEFSPTMVLSKKANLGLYYIGSKGLTSDLIKNTSFVALRTGLTLPITQHYTLGLIPQAYYLKMDQRDGTYGNITFNFYKKNFPISINAIASKAFKTNITGKDFLWGIGLVYNINNDYLKK
jgi:hypothetical protein